MIRMASTAQMRQRTLPANVPETAAAIRFSDGMLIAVLLAKPIADALYEFGPVKYGYMALLLFAAFFTFVGRQLGGLPGLEPVEARHHVRHLVAAAVYLVFLLGSLAVYLGSFTEIFKILSPFVLFIVLAPLLAGWFVKVLGVGSLLVIMSNAALLPLDFGWVQWGGVRTFKGYYFFKTDLAYAIAFATFSVALWQRFRFTPILLLAIALAAVQIILSNSRLNYLLFAAVALFTGFKGGLSVAAMLKALALLALTVVVSLLLFDPSKMLGFDVSNMAGFTQGRNKIWDILLDDGLMSFSLAEWIFGKGLFADLKVVAENTFSGSVHNAHNEWLHLLITQGLFGVGWYLCLWITMLRFATDRPLPSWARGVAPFALVLIALQSMTAVVSSFATKTWPVVLVMLAVASSARNRTP